MPLLIAKGGSDFVEANENSYQFVVPLMLHSYTEAIKAILVSKNHKHIAKTYMALREVRAEIDQQLAEADVGLEFIKAKMFGEDDGEER